MEIIRRNHQRGFWARVSSPFTPDHTGAAADPVDAALQAEAALEEALLAPETGKGDHDEGRRKRRSR